MDILLAFSAGLLSFLSPCILPLVPAYLSYIAGSAASEIMTGRTGTGLLLRAAFFTAGFSLVFILLGITAGAVGKILSENIIWLKRVGGVLVFLLGLHMTGLIKIKQLYAEKRLLSRGTLGKKVGPFVMGLAFAAGWTPCVGPILSSILIYAGSLETVYKGAALLTVYALGLAVPFLLAALLFDSFSSFYKRFSKWLPYVSVLGGVLLMGMGVLIFTDRLSMISRYFSVLGV